jgi:membrane-associated phospholipid phosphatase
MRSKARSDFFRGAIFFVTLLSFSIMTKAQDASPSPSPQPQASPAPSLEHQFFRNVMRDQVAIWTAPFHLHQRDARWLAPIGVGTLALIATDRRTGDEIGESTGQLKASRFISRAGSSYFTGGVAATFYLFGRAKHDTRARETGVLGAEALLDSAIVVTALKEVTQRRRPGAAKGRGDFFDGGSSFPSGHSIEAWSLATVIANEYHDHRAVQFAAYGIAAAVSVSRYTGHNHFLSDVLVGSAMGYGIGQYVYHAHHRVTNDPSDQNRARHAKLWPMIAPQYNRRAREYGAALAWSF